LFLGKPVEEDLLHWERLSELVFSLFRHLPGEESSKLWRGLAAVVHAGMEERVQPMTGIEAPHQDSLEPTKALQN
jgi:hypothetical protein